MIEKRLMTDEEMDYFFKACYYFNTAGPKVRAFEKAYFESGKSFDHFDKVEYERICKEENISCGEWMEGLKDLARTTQGR